MGPREKPEDVRRSRRVSGRLYELARKTGKVDMNRKSGEKKQQSGSPARCFSCGQIGHRAFECRKNRRVEERGAAKPVGVQERRPQSNQTWREPRCYECGKLGHLSMRCPSKALFSEGRSAGRETTNGRSRPLRRSGVVNGKTVADIVLDTGCTRTLVHDSWFQLDRGPREQ